MSDPHRASARTPHPDPARPGSGEGALRHSGRAFLLALYTGLRSLKLYPIENATAQKALDDLQAAAVNLLASEEEIELRISGDFLFINATRLRLELENYASFSYILAMFATFDIGTLWVRQGVERKEWQIFVGLLLNLAAMEETPNKLLALSDRLKNAKVTNIEVEPTVETQEQLDELERAKEMAKRTYSQGVAVTKEVVNSVRMGRTASIKKVKRAVQAIVDQVLNNETSLMGLTTIRDYDEYTFTHSVNVCIFSVALGRRVGFSRLQLYDLGLAALMHDIGKARIPIDILNKTSGLDEKEWFVIQGHPAGRPHALRDAGLQRDSLPVDRGRARAPHEDRPDRLSPGGPAPGAGTLLPHRGGSGWIRRRDDAAFLPERADPAGRSAPRNVGEPAPRV